VREFELAFGSVEDGFFECDGEADAGVENLVVVGVVVDGAAEEVGVEAELVRRSFCWRRFRNSCRGKVARAGAERSVRRIALRVELESRMFSNDGV
jgi:hypothetical protein